MRWRSLSVVLGTLLAVLPAGAQESSWTRLPLEREANTVTGRERGELQVALSEAGATLVAKLRGLERDHDFAISVGSANLGIVARFRSSHAGTARVHVDLLGPPGAIATVADPRGVETLVSSIEGFRLLSAHAFADAAGSPRRTRMHIVHAIPPSAVAGPGRADYVRSASGADRLDLRFAGLSPGTHAVAVQGGSTDVEIEMDGSLRVALASSSDAPSHASPGVLRGPLTTSLPTNLISAAIDGVEAFDGEVFANVPGFAGCAPASRSANLVAEPGEVGTASVLLERDANCSVVLTLTLTDVQATLWNTWIESFGVLESVGGAVVSDDGEGTGSSQGSAGGTTAHRSGNPIFLERLDPVSGTYVRAFSGTLP